VEAELAEAKTAAGVPDTVEGGVDLVDEFGFDVPEDPGSVPDEILNPPAPTAEAPDSGARCGVTLIKGATYTVGDKKYIRGKTYGVTRAMRDHLVGRGNFIDKLPDEERGEQVAEPLMLNQVSTRRTTVKNLTPEQRAARKKARIEAKSNIGERVRGAPQANEPELEV